jgi:hypothetical protein
MSEDREVEDNYDGLAGTNHPCALAHMEWIAFRPDTEYQVVCGSQFADVSYAQQRTRMKTALRLSAGATHTVSIPSLKGSTPASDFPPAPTILRITTIHPKGCRQAGQEVAVVTIRVRSDVNQLFLQEVKAPGTIVFEFTDQFIQQRAPKGIEIAISAGSCGFQGEFEIQPLP